MPKFVLRRLLQAVPLLLIISLLVYGVVELAPGEAAQMYIDPEKGADPAYIDQIRQSLGLDQPVHARYLAW